MNGEGLTWRSWWIFAVLSMSHVITPKTLYFVAEEYLFNEYHQARDQCTKAFHVLKAAAERLGYTIKAVKSLDNLMDVEAIIFFDLHARFLNQLQKYPAHKLILYLWEPPLHDPLGNDPAYQKAFGKVFSLWSRYVDGNHVLQHFYVQPGLTMIRDVVDFDRKRFCAMIIGYKSGSDLYVERFRAIEFFESLHEDVFDLYGAGWPRRKSYKGEVAHKKDILKNYRFSICYENSSQYEGYVTEKIFDCFVAGCVPVYWGAPDIEKYIPSDCFIDKRQFVSLGELYQFLATMKRDVYEKYLSNIRSFLSSPAAYRYSIDYFVDRFFAVINPSYNRSRIFSKEQQDCLAVME